MKKIFTSESVTSGHPDKICDQVSDAVLDEFLKLDKNARVACEVAVTTNFMLIMGEISSTAQVDVKNIARSVIRDIGYTDENIGFSDSSVDILVKLNRQSVDIANGVDNPLCASSSDVYDRLGAGDQGMMFGCATDETKEYMPLPIVLSHKLCKGLEDIRKSGELDYLRPDGKGQVTVEYDGTTPTRVRAIVLSSQHNDRVSIDVLRKDLKEKVIDRVIPKKLIDKDTEIYINPTGRFEIGGPNGDSGLTGRKIIVDTYGGACPHGGGAFSGKDATKVDRSAAYMTRYIAKNIVASKMAKMCQIQVSYAIGVSKPISVRVDTFGTGKLNDEQIADIVLREFDLRPAAIIDRLQLNTPIFRKTATYGHFGKEGFPWEQVDKVKDLKKYL